MKPKEPRGPIFQDTNFVFKEFDGIKLEQLVVCEEPETNEPITIYLKVENNNWHQYFLDAGLGFWQNWNEIDYDFDNYNYVDKTSSFGLFEKVIHKIWCEQDKNNSQIIIEFESNDKLVLKTINPEKFDSECELIKYI